MTTHQVSQTYNTDTGPVQVTAPDLAVLATEGLRERTRILDPVRTRGAGPHPRHRPMPRRHDRLADGLPYRMEAALRVDVNLQRLLLVNSAQELINCLTGQLGPASETHLHGLAVPA